VHKVANCQYLGVVIDEELKCTEILKVFIINYSNIPVFSTNYEMRLYAFIHPHISLLYVIEI